MAKLFLTSIDLNSNELQNGVIQNLASAPGTPTKGRIYMDSTLNKIGYYNGTSWIYVAISSVTATLPLTATTDANGAVSIAINAATTSAAGSMSATDKVKLDSSTSTNTASSLVFRDASGNFAANLITVNQGTVVNAPTAATDIANKAYVDGLAQGLDVKASVRAATTANIVLSSAQTVDGVVLVAGDRVLVKDQTLGAENGIYVVVGAAAWTRSTDADTSAKVTAGMFTFIEEGTLQGDQGWILTTNQAIVLGTTALVFVQFSSAGVILAGAGLLKTGNTVDIVLGPNGGLVINPDNLAVDFASTVETDAKSVTNKAVTPAGLINHPRKFVQTGVSIGTTPGTVTITHNLGVRPTQVTLIDSTSFIEYELDVANPTINTITLIANGATKTVIVSIVG